MQSLMVTQMNIYMLFAGRDVRIGKNCARGLEHVLKTSGTVFPNTDRPRPASKPVLFTKVFKRRASVFADFKTEQ